MGFVALYTEAMASAINVCVCVCVSHQRGYRRTDRQTQSLQMRWWCRILSFLLSLVERTSKSVWNSGSSNSNPLLNFYPCVSVCFSQSVSHSRTPLPAPRPTVATLWWLLLLFCISREDNWPLRSVFCCLCNSLEQPTSWRSWQSLIRTRKLLAFYVKVHYRVHSWALS
jgi:hypothetical protein